MFVAIDGQPAGPGRRRRSDQGDRRRSALEALRAEGLRDRHADRRQPHDRRGGRAAARHRRGRSAEVLPEQKAATSSSACSAAGTRRGDGRRRHQRRAGARRRPTSASRWAPAPTSRWRAPASRWSRATCAASCARGGCRRATMRNIRQNLFFAFVYNALGVPIAAGRALSLLRPAAQPDDRRARR